MDVFELERRERWAELADSIAQADRNNEARARRHSWLRFWFSPWQVVDGPDVPVPASGECSNPRSSLGAGSGAAGSMRRTPAVAPNRGLVSGSQIPGGPSIVGSGPGEPQLALPPRASEKPGPARHHLPCSEASRISAANRHT